MVISKLVQSRPKTPKFWFSLNLEHISYRKTWKLSCDLWIFNVNASFVYLYVFVKEKALTARRQKYEIEQTRAKQPKPWEYEISVLLTPSKYQEKSSSHSIIKRLGKARDIMCVVCVLRV